MRIQQFLALTLLAVSLHAFADMSLDEAKGQGLVGEDASGYLAAVTSSPSRDVRALVSAINTKRREEYERIAEENKISVSDVELLAGRKAIMKTLPGHYIRLQDSDWEKR